MHPGNGPQCGNAPAGLFAASRKPLAGRKADTKPGKRAGPPGRDEQIDIRQAEPNMFEQELQAVEKPVGMLYRRRKPDLPCHVLAVQNRDTAVAGTRVDRQNPHDRV